MLTGRSVCLPNGSNFNKTGLSFIVHICLCKRISFSVGLPPVVYHPKKSKSLNTCLTFDYKNF